MLLMLVDNCYLLNYNELKQLVLPNSFIVSGDNNSNLHPVFILKNNSVFDPIWINFNW